MYMFSNTMCLINKIHKKIKSWDLMLACANHCFIVQCVANRRNQNLISRFVNPKIIQILTDCQTIIFQIIIGNQDRTSEFTRSTEVNGTRCIITLTKLNYIGTNDNGKTIQTVISTTAGNVSTLLELLFRI